MAVLLYITLGMLLVALPHRAEAIRCWSCNSDEDARCGDPFDNRTIHLRDCNDGMFGSMQQMRYCSKIKIDVNGHYVYYRSCSHTEGLCPDAVGPGHCATCGDKDGCNSAPGTYLLPGLLFGALLLLQITRH